MKLQSAGFYYTLGNKCEDEARCVKLKAEDFERVNPNTGTAPIFLNDNETRIITDIYRRCPVLVSHATPLCRTFELKYHTMFHMSGDAHLFKTEANLKEEGYYPVTLNRWKCGENLYFPLYQARMIDHFDHRRNSVKTKTENLHNPFLSNSTTESQHQDPTFLPKTEYFIPHKELVMTQFPIDLGYALGFRDITNATNWRTVIASIVPLVGCGHTLPTLVPLAKREPALSNYQVDLPKLLGNLNSFALDFVARSKIPGTHLSWYVLEQLPVISKENYSISVGQKTVNELIRETVLELTYTAVDVEPFAREQGYNGPPFIWDAERRRHLKARLDALYFHLYGISHKDATYILDTFPIVEKHDIKEFGHYRTKDLILAYMNALLAGDTEDQSECLRKFITREF